MAITITANEIGALGEDIATVMVVDGLYIAPFAAESFNGRGGHVTPIGGGNTQPDPTNYDYAADMINSDAVGNITSTNVQGALVELADITSNLKATSKQDFDAMREERIRDGAGSGSVFLGGVVSV
jgi:hypothetical protein